MTIDDQLLGQRLTGIFALSFHFESLSRLLVQTSVLFPDVVTVRFHLDLIRNGPGGTGDLGVGDP